MGKLSRREFTRFLGGAVAAGGVLGSWPKMAEAVSAAGEPAGDLAGLSLAEASAKIHNRSITSTQLTKAMLERIGVYDSKLNSYITVMGKEALEQAAQLDAEQKAGKFRGPLHGYSRYEDDGGEWCI
jgi:aspartyl-tRNA(Asn)/glutamyl-tRNA(Gln) amidotransferase subunit A